VINKNLRHCFWGDSGIWIYNFTEKYNIHNNYC